uniref:Uncharacterized protein n=2 Tax=Ceratitis capitata TaxID=7213 RepID=W8B284_CERCA
MCMEGEIDKNNNIRAYMFGKVGRNNGNDADDDEAEDVIYYENKEEPSGSFEGNSAVLKYVGDKKMLGNNLARSFLPKYKKQISTLCSCTNNSNTKVFKHLYAIYETNYNNSRKEYSGIIIKRQKRSPSYIVSNDVVKQTQLSHSDYNDDNTTQELPNLNDSNNNENNMQFNTTTTGRRYSKLLVRRSKLIVPSAPELLNSSELMFRVAVNETALQPMLRSTVKLVLRRKIIVIRKPQQDRRIQIETMETTTQTPKFPKYSSNNSSTKTQSANSIKSLNESHIQRPLFNKTGEVGINKLLLIANLSSQKVFHTHIKRNDTKAHDRTMQPSNFNARGRIVRKRINRRLRKFDHNDLNHNSIRITTSTKNTTKSLQRDELQFKTASYNSSTAETMTPNKTIKKRRRKKQGRIQRKRNQKLRTTNRNFVTVVAKSQTKLNFLQAQSIFMQQSRQILMPFQLSSIISRNQTDFFTGFMVDSKQKTAAIVSASAVRPTTLLNTRFLNIAHTSLYYEVASSIQYETIIHTRTYTYVVDRVHGDQHHHIESSTLVRAQTQVLPHTMLITHTLTNMIM